MRRTATQKDPLATGIKKWLIIATALLGAILELIDSTIVTVSLPDMMGNLGANTLQIAWVVSIYAIGNLITVTLSAMFSSFFGRKKYFTSSIIIFTGASLMCGLSSSLWMLIFWRFVQGLGGGGLLATAQSIIAEAFPPKELALATGIFGIGVLLGPAIGPVLGGIITEYWSWHWIFFVNIPLGIIAASLSWLFIPNLVGARKPKKIDIWGIIFLIVFVFTLEYFLEEGSSNYWFESTKITASFIIAIVSLAAFVIREITVKNPAVNIKLYKNPNLALGHVMNFILGILLVCMAFIFPLFTQDTLGWTALKQGVFLLPPALISAVATFLTGKFIAKRIGLKATAISGICLLSVFFILFSFSSPDSGAKNFFGPYVLFSIAKALIAVPLMTLALVGLRGEDLAHGTGLSTIMRRIGSTIGATLIALYLESQHALVSSNLIGNLNVYNEAFNTRINLLSDKLRSVGYGTLEASRGAFQIVQSAVNKQVQI
ncbi:MAG TPA: DHA2 family efflux MFS transporter permease subunit, partial [Flavobacteriaceae bacterium]|nr:DHA2 family efflux MFS transporter permease subunit [Flavobacteriaceae bacterium]